MLMAVRNAGAGDFHDDDCEPLPLRCVPRRPCVADLLMQQLKMTKFPAAAPLKAARAVLNRQFLQMITPMGIWYFCNCASS
jgi:hypothetical protein